MVRDKIPAFQFYPMDFLSDGKQAAMSLAEVGVYIRLICICWVDGRIPDDPARLANQAGATRGQMLKLWPAVRTCFQPDPDQIGWLVHPRLLKERQKQEEFRKVQRQRGRDRAASGTRAPGGQFAPARHQPDASQDTQCSAGEPSQPAASSSIFNLQTSVLKKEREERISLSPPADPFTNIATTTRASEFITRYQTLYEKHRKGAKYAVRPVRDYAAAVTLCDTWLDDRLDKLAAVFLLTDHEFAESGSRTIPQFLGLASWCDGKLAAHEAKR